MGINRNLQELYLSNWDNLSKKINDLKQDDDQIVEPTNPLLIYISDEEKYLRSDLKVMVFGQETNDWEGGFSKEKMDHILKTYDDFYNSGSCYKRGGHFWNGVKRFNERLQNKFTNKSIHFVWNNVVKIGKNNEKNIPSDQIIHIELEHFNVVQRELEILEPDLLLFFSGPNYDHQIKTKINDVKYLEIDGFKTRELAELRINNIQFSFRTYHPNYLWRNNIDKYFDGILNKISFDN